IAQASTSMYWTISMTLITKLKNNISKTDILQYPSDEAQPNRLKGSTGESIHTRMEDTFDRNILQKMFFETTGPEEGAATEKAVKEMQKKQPQDYVSVDIVEQFYDISLSLTNIYMGFDPSSGSFAQRNSKFPSTNADEYRDNTTAIFLYGIRLENKIDTKAIAQYGSGGCHLINFLFMFLLCKQMNYWQGNCEYCAKLLVALLGIVNMNISITTVTVKVEAKNYDFEQILDGTILLDTELKEQ
ncbi:hypothetical protein ACJX0J_027846, partial [Zea mays]